MTDYDIIKTYINSIPNICTNIGEEYRLNSLRKSSLVIVYHTTEEGKSDNEQLLGFITADYSPNRFIYIDLICTNYRYKGVGKQLLQVVKDIAKKSGIPKITLNSLLSSVPFYTYQGFNVNIGKLDVTLLPMKYNMSKYEGGKRKTKRRTTRPKKRPSKTRRR
jgi:GNAT superfamily N-acetyltransferase